jgi:hypothetical protein
MVNYYKFKENNPEIQTGVNPINMRFMGDDDVLSVLPYREQTGRRIMIYRIGKYNTVTHPVTAGILRYPRRWKCGLCSSTLHSLNCFVKNIYGL